MSFEEVKKLSESGQHDEALRVIGKCLNANPNDYVMLYMAARTMSDKDWPGIGKPLAWVATQLAPTNSEAWNLLGKCQADVWETPEAYDSFRKALQYGTAEKVSPLSNMAQCEIVRCKPKSAISLCLKALAKQPDNFNAKHNMGMALLMLRQWKDGWKLYDAGLGRHATRKELLYGDEPRWDGTKGQTVVAYGEQGIGDEISFASTIPDLVKDCKVVIDCDSRLEGLFKRSFPEADVYGTRFRVGDDWPDRYKFDGRVAFSSLQGFYRNHDSDFPRKPYLVPDPERRVQWRALLDQLPGKKVGIAWTGGVTSTGKAYRSLKLEDLLPILKVPGASFVSLEYRDPTEEIAALRERHGIVVHEWGRATRTQDTDDLAALVSELDLVISVTTAVIHLAGGLGKEVWVMTHRTPMWRYGLDHDDMIWYPNVRLLRQKTESWTYVINRIAEELSARLS